MPLLHFEVTKRTYQYIVDKIRKKLSNWDAMRLSLARRVTLAQSMIGAIPIYAMQTMNLPASICEEIDKLCRNFLWGSIDGSKRLALVPWKVINYSKEFRGLGFKDTKLTDKAFLMKLPCNNAKDKEALWVRVLGSRYKVNEEPVPIPVTKANSSCFWRGICSVWDSF